MSFSQYIDHTLLKADALPSDIEKLCAEARTHHFVSCCVNPYFVPLTRQLLAGSGVKVCTVIGFPLGASTTAVKVAETKDAIANGADEIDMVINIAALKAGLDEVVRQDIASVVQAADGRIVKVIIETCLLTDEQKRQACRLIMQAGAHFVKTSTGFSTGGATVNDVILFKSVVGDRVLIKASGGVKTQEQMQSMINAGASRIGTSNGVALVSNMEVTGGY